MFDLRAIITALMYETKPLERRTAVSPRRGDMMMVNAKYTGGPCIVYNFAPEEKRAQHAEIHIWLQKSISF